MIRQVSAVLALVLLLFGVADSLPPAPTGGHVVAPSTPSFTLTVDMGTSTGTGTVTAAGIDCGSDCAESYIQNTIVFLFASPGVNSTFTGWSGACSGTGSCSVTMSTTRSVTATFTSGSVLVTNGDVYYVSGSTGSPANPCTPNNPSVRKQTIAQGLACLTSAGGGNTLVIGPGTYTEVIAAGSIPSGTGVGSEAPEAAWPGATVIRAEALCTVLNATTQTCSTILRPTSTQCGPSANAGLIRLYLNSDSPRYVIFQGFEADANSQCQQVFSAAVTGAQSFNEPQHIRIQNVYFHDATGALGGTGMIGPFGHIGHQNVHHIEVLDSVIRNFNLGGVDPGGTQGGIHCLYFNAGGTIRRNIISQCSPTDHNGQGIGTHNGVGLAVDISGNDVSGFGFQGIEVASVDNGKVYNNVVHDGAFASCDNTGVGANGFFCNGIVVNGSGGASNTIIANNTVYNVLGTGGGSGIKVLFGGTSNTSIQNNIVYGTNGTISATNGGSLSDGGTVSNNRCDSGCTTSANPAFVDAPGGNFRLTVSSPSSITQGGVDLSSSFMIDKDLVTRSVPWSMGAYEF